MSALAAIADYGACALEWMRMSAAHKLARPADHAGLTLSFRDGTTSRVFRETVVVGAATAEPVLLVIAFRLAFLDDIESLHAGFRRECLIHTPLFAGFGGMKGPGYTVTTERIVVPGSDSCRSRSHRSASSPRPFCASTATAQTMKHAVASCDRITPPLVSLFIISVAIWTPILLDAIDRDLAVHDPECSGCFFMSPGFSAFKNSIRSRRSRDFREA